MKSIRPGTFTSFTHGPTGRISAGASSVARCITVPPEDVRFEHQYAETQASYARWFGHEPPADIWPTPEIRFAPQVRFTRVNVAAYWMLPKQHIRRLAVACLLAALPLVTLAACAGTFGNVTISPAVPILFVLLFVVFVVRSVRRGSGGKGDGKGGDGGGCGASCGGGSDSSGHHHDSSSGCSSSGCSSGCGGGGCGGGGD